MLFSLGFKMMLQRTHFSKISIY